VSQEATCKQGHVSPTRNSRGECLSCKRILNRKYAKQNPDRRRNIERASRLGVSTDVIRSVIDRCGGKCEACGDTLSSDAMCIDHDHGTGLIRGVLCRFCNALEGMLNKKADRVQLVRQYVLMATARAERESK